MRTRTGSLWLLALTFMDGLLPALADVYVPEIFGSNMVLQQDMAVPGA